MNKLRYSVVIATLALLNAACGKSHPPLPAEIKAIQCEASARMEIVASGYEIFHLDGTTIVAPCRKPGSSKFMERIWQVDENKSPRETSPLPSKSFIPWLYFIKTPDGRIVVSEHALAPLWSKVATYGATIGVMHDDPAPLSKGRRWQPVTVPTPDAFKATGDETTFWCAGPRYDLSRDGYYCQASVRSESLHWLINVSYGKPADDDIDMEPVVREVYGLLAAHILAQ